jgi:site-specific recombinase XerD
MSTDAYLRANAVKAFRGAVVPAGRHVEDGEFQSLFEALAKEQTVKGKRDLALLSVARATGARREELTSLDLADLDLRSMVVRIDGKGRRERESVLASWVRGPLQAWLAVRKSIPGPLFAVVRHNGQVSSPLKRLTNPGMDGVLRKRLAQFELESFSWHDVRRSYVTSRLDDGADLRAIMLQVGHTNPKTTMRYDRREKRKLQAIARSVPSPFSGGGSK